VYRVVLRECHGMISVHRSCEVCVHLEYRIDITTDSTLAAFSVS
jgi:hypothetical protein